MPVPRLPTHVLRYPQRVAPLAAGIVIVGAHLTARSADAHAARHVFQPASSACSPARPASSTARRLVDEARRRPHRYREDSVPAQPRPIAERSDARQAAIPEAHDGRARHAARIVDADRPKAPRLGTAGRPCGRRCNGGAQSRRLSRPWVPPFVATLWLKCRCIGRVVHTLCVVCVIALCGDQAR
jgi:hypothetical protein